MGGMCLSRDSNSLLIMAATWKCCRTPWSLLLHGVFSACAGPDPPRPKWWVENVLRGTQEQPHPVSNVWGGCRRLNLHTLQMPQSWSSLNVCEAFESPGALSMGHKACWVCTSALHRGPRWCCGWVVSSPFLLFPRSPQVHACSNHPARSWWLSNLGFLGFCPHWSLSPAPSHRQTPDQPLVEQVGDFFTGVFHCGALELESRGDGGVAHLQDRGPGAGQCMICDFPRSWRQAKLWRYSLKI